MVKPLLRGRLLENEPMARHVTWRAGGVVARAYFPPDLADLCAFLSALSGREPVYFVGLGSNLLVRDGGLQATVVFTHRALGGLSPGMPDADGQALHVGAGVACPKVARFAALHNLGGAEFLAGIPGTMGGALAMNAGCYGSETWTFVKTVTTVDRKGVLHERLPAEYAVAYRSVRPADARSEEWFVGAKLVFPVGDGERSRARIKDLLARRIASQPLQQPNAGSVFRNPPGDFAARLIEACGLKGHAIGGAAISAKHANFIVNLGGATAADIEALIDLAQDEVRRRHGVELEREVRIVGASLQNADTGAHA